MQPFESQFAGGSPPFPHSLLRERRSVRHKVHTPAYASLQQASTETVLDLCEILDISERGALLQTPVGWQLGTALDLLLDFSETQTKVRTRGEVVWSDAGGRVGVRFPELTADARRQLQEWLFLNVMVAAANHAVGVESPAAQRVMPSLPQSQLAAVTVDEDEILSETQAREFNHSAREFSHPEPAEAEFFGSSRADYTTTLAALTAVQREVEAVGDDLDAALQLIGARTRTFTRASGSAIAIVEPEGMVCRASYGEAPPVGTVLEPGAGLSGRCFQTGLLQRCDDAERDLRVDREICRELNIRSILAVPVRRGDRMLGLLEVFSPRSYAFGDMEAAALQRLSETVLAVLHRSGHLAAIPAAAKPAPPAPKQNGKTIPKLVPPPVVLTPYPFATMLETSSSGELSFLRRHLAVLVGIAILILAALAYILVPMVVGRITTPRSQPPAPASQTSTPPPAVQGFPSLDQIRQRADQGDPSAQFTLGTRYATGEDVPQDYSIAARWFQKAAEQGLVIAQDTLGNYYWAGRGVPKNITQAYYWSVLARRGGNQASELRIHFLAPQLTPEQAHSIERSAEEFFLQHPPIERRELR
jgi:GAF domain-containing protein